MKILFIDWWAIGVLLYELVTHHAPFGSTGSEIKIYERITNYKHGTLDMEGVDDVGLISLIHSFLNPAVRLRLGTAKGIAKDGMKEVFEHDFFKDINVDKICKGTS